MTGIIIRCRHFVPSPSITGPRLLSLTSLQGVRNLLLTALCTLLPFKFALGPGRAAIAAAASP